MEDSYQLTPSTELLTNERVEQSFQADRSVYIRDHAWMAAGAMAVGMLILWAIGNPHIWTGGVGGLAAIAIRGFYVASDELNVRWDLTNLRLLGPQTRVVLLGDIENVRILASAIQVISKTGDKHLLKYQGDRNSTKAAIMAAAANT
ncbi:MAG: hypothetical protein P8L68_10170 [Paracoccaceae bacterium]|nr:hypothetical protein [Paracoccaceae bacterium]MDG1736358.1 hypothetical protein [Paracoccaceae bacterium]MDG2258844.1 hypothetical protein [Paracoccaceae bacterium]